MIRTVFIPLLKQKGVVTASACIGGTIAIMSASSSFSNRSNYQFPRLTLSDSAGQVSGGNISMSIDMIKAFGAITDEAEQCCSMVVPTLEALARAARLISTATFMAADYKMNSMQRENPDSPLTRIYNCIIQSKDPGHQEDEQMIAELEYVIDRLEKDLERAQSEYVSYDGKDHGKQTLPSRTLAKREQKETMLSIANGLANAQEALTDLHKNRGATYNIHQRNALRLLNLCRTNGGVYVKVGQHLANLDLLLPEEYINTLSALFDNASATTYSDMCKVVKEELGSTPDELFDNFSKRPFASASLAQVHTAKCKITGKKLAIKVQHARLRETSAGDLFAMSTVVQIVDKLFDDFNFMWICEELTPQLPKELNFINEGQNAEAAAYHLATTGLDCIVPRVLWEHTSARVLTMEFEEGFKATDVDQIQKAGIEKRDVAKLISSVFNAQIFQNGFVHCDPHEANVLLREHPTKKGKPQIVLVDHGLYKTLDAGFQEAYARLWKGIVVADIEEIKNSCKSLGVTKMVSGWMVCHSQI